MKMAVTQGRWFPMRAGVAQSKVSCPVINASLDSQVHQLEKPLHQAPLSSAGVRSAQGLQSCTTLLLAARQGCYSGLWSCYGRQPAFFAMCRSGNSCAEPQGVRQPVACCSSNHGAGSSSF